VIYREFLVSPALDDLVDRIYFVEGRAEELGSEPIPPDGHTEIIVHAGDPFVEIAADGTSRVQDRVLFAGQVTRAVRVRPQGTARFVGARLRPDAARRLTGVPQYALVDAIVPLAEIDRALGKSIEDDVLARRTADAMACALESALVRTAHAGDASSPVHAAIDLAIARRGLVRVDDLASRASLGARQLERLFREHVGLGPKLFLRIQRFQHVLAAVRARRTDGVWSAVAAEHGFYDQSHFIRDFKTFVGAVPSEWDVDDASLAALFSAAGRR
jgi:AraC-like DNA-binding protein